MKQVAHPVALVFVIVGMAAPGRGGRSLRVSPTSCLLVFIQTHQHLVVLELAVVHLQHVLHGADKLGISLGRDAPAFLQPRLEFVFFSVWRTVSALMLWTN